MSTTSPASGPARGGRRRSIPDRINVLLIGGGGREHALAWKIRQSARLGQLWTTHATNPGIAAIARAVDFPFSMREAYRAAQFCQHQQIHLVVVGPEQPLAEGIADALASEQTAVFGPTREAAQLEANKAWAKQLMRAAAIPTAEARIFSDAQGARDYILSREEPVVVKAAGLAGGKGVVVADSREEALDAVERMMERKEFGDAGREIVIEERLTGPEVSVFALVDGRNILILDPAQDHKRVGEGDTGPNTGGMGAFCPSPLLDGPGMDRVMREILVPTVDALRREGIEYRGLLYAGLMLTHAGPKVLEFNVRFGDPECQALLHRVGGDFLATLFATAVGRLDEAQVEISPRHACCVVLASRGYPGPCETGKPVKGIEAAERMPGVTVFHAGTALDKEGRLVTAGGRVLNVVGVGESLAEARERAYQACDMIEFEGKTLRRDIGLPKSAAPRIRERIKAP